MEPAELYDHLYVHYAGAAVEHVFSVASGLDSMVVGETQILGQVRTAYATARETGTVGSTLHELIQTTLRVGKRVHTETGLDRLGASVVSEALAAAGDCPVGGRSWSARARWARWRPPNCARGASPRSSSATAPLSGPPDWSPRSPTQGVTAKAAPMAELADEVARADVVVVCTGAKNAVFGTEHVAPRADRPVVVCDLGLPRDVEPEVGSVPGVTLVDLETVRKRMAESGTATTDKQLAKASGIILDEVRAYLAGQRSAAVTPTVTALRKRAAEVVDAELLRLDRRLPDLDPTSVTNWAAPCGASWTNCCTRRPCGSNNSPPRSRAPTTRNACGSCSGSIRRPPRRCRAPRRLPTRSDRRRLVLSPVGQ